MADETVTSGRPDNVTGTKIARKTIISHLLFAFYGHDPERYESIKPDGEVRAAAIRELIRALNIVYRAVEDRKFDRASWAWIDDEFIRINFENRKFNLYYKQIKAEDLDFLPIRATKLRAVFSAICAISRGIFEHTSTRTQFSYIAEVRDIFKIAPSRETKGTPLTVLRQVERELRKISGKPVGAISFDNEGQPIIKTKRRDFFPSEETVRGAQDIVAGRFIVYRKIFTLREDERNYIRDYLVIENRGRSGTTFRWESRGTSEDRAVEFLGVCLFADGALWLIGHCAEPFKRMRIAAANLAEWRLHFRDAAMHPFCTCVVMSNREEGNEKAPITGTALVRREKPLSDWRDPRDSFKDRIRSYTRPELLQILSADEVAMLDRQVTSSVEVITPMGLASR